MIASPQPSSHNQLKSLNSFSASLLGDKSYGLELRRFAVFFCGCFVPTIMKADGLGPFKKSKTFLQAILCCSLPGDFISAGPDYLTVQWMGHGIKVPVEIFINRHLMDISAHRRAITAGHPQVALWRHISGKVHTHCFELCEPIGYGQRREIRFPNNSGISPYRCRLLEPECCSCCYSQPKDPDNPRQSHSLCSRLIQPHGLVLRSDPLPAIAESCQCTRTVLPVKGRSGENASFNPP